MYLASAKKTSEEKIISPLQKIKVAKAKVNPAKNREVIGFLPSWTVAQNTKIDIKPFTQIIYFGLGVKEDGQIVQFDEEKNPTLEWHYFTSENFSCLKKEAKETEVKVLVSFKMFNNESIDNLISNANSTNYFIKNVIALLKKYDLDGVNLDIEYFTDSDFPTSRFLNSFLNTVSKEIKKNNPKAIVSLDVNATAILSDKAYDMVKIGEVADEVILMAYDYHTQSSQRAGPVAPINAPINEHSITESISSITGRVPLEKVILGVPLYGYEWQTLNKNNRSTVVAGSGALATYKRVQELLENRGDIEKHWDEDAQSPWLVYVQSGAIKQIYYEDERSIKVKADFVKTKDLGGVALWALGYEGKYKEPLKIISSIK